MGTSDKLVPIPFAERDQNGKKENGFCQGYPKHQQAAPRRGRLSISKPALSVKD
jgi:hypothetical protein